MKKLLCILCLMSIVLSGCGFHLQRETEIPQQFKKMAFYSNDPYGQLSRYIRDALKENEVILVENTQGYLPSLTVMNSQISKTTISIYPDGKSAEYQLILTVNAQVTIADDDIYPTTVKVFRTFFDNPATALAKSTEQSLIEKEMYQQAALQLLGKLKSINSTGKNK